MKSNFKKAVFSEDYTHIIDAKGNKINPGDPNVEHIWFINDSFFKAARFIKSVFESRGWRIRFLEPTFDMIYYSKLLCSGRECAALNILSGMYYEDVVKNLIKDEIFVYWGMEHVCPCQISGWPDVFAIFSERIGNPNAIYSVDSTLENNYFGQGLEFGMSLITAFILGDLFDEAEWTLKTIALNKEAALRTYDEETRKVSSNLHKGIEALESSLKEWANNMRKIPLKTTVDKAPKVLLFGGGSGQLFRGLLTDYWYQQGIIPKNLEFREFVLYLFTHYARSYGFKRGWDKLEQQLRLESIVPSFINSGLNKREINLAVSSCLILEFADSISKRFRKTLESSGLIYDEYESYMDSLKEGHQFINDNIFTEVGGTIGRYLRSIQTEVFDGLVNIAVFNCQPSKNGQAALRALSQQYNIPFAALELEDLSLSTNHYRLLENVVVQARRIREAKNAGQKNNLQTAAAIG